MSKANEVFRKYISKKPLRITHETIGNSHFVKKRLQLIPSEDLKQALQELEQEMLKDELNRWKKYRRFLTGYHYADWAKPTKLLDINIQELKDKINENKG